MSNVGSCRYVLECKLQTFVAIRLNIVSRAKHALRQNRARVGVRQSTKGWFTWKVGPVSWTCTNSLAAEVWSTMPGMWVSTKRHLDLEWSLIWALCTFVDFCGFFLVMWGFQVPFDPSVWAPRCGGDAHRWPTSGRLLLQRVSKCYTFDYKITRWDVLILYYYK